MITESEKGGHYSGSPGHPPGHDELVGVVVLASAEVRHAGEAVWQHFSTCHSLADIATQVTSLDEATFVGVIAFAAIFCLFIKVGISTVAGKIAQWLRSRNESSSP
jgi:hypothetical protein